MLAAKGERTGYIRRLLGKGVKFERIRRITGYLVGTVDRFNNAKRKEERGRVEHGFKATDPLPQAGPESEDGP